jgi:photosystem II stability/assembly factor-like uncharacterized protein
MKKIFSILLFSLIPITACSSEPELAYDPVELIEYEKCLNTIPPNFTAEIWASGGIAEQYCEPKKPILK